MLTGQKKRENLLQKKAIPMRNWRVLSPDDLPEDGQKIYYAVINGAGGEKSSKVFRDVFIRRFQGVEWMGLWYRNLRQLYGGDVVIVWQPIPEEPKLPKAWTITAPRRCDQRTCQFFDDGYCLGGPSYCEHAAIHREFVPELD